MKNRNKSSVVGAMAAMVMLLTATACHEDFWESNCAEQDLSEIQQFICDIVCPECSEKPDELGACCFGYGCADGWTEHECVGGSGGKFFAGKNCRDVCAEK